MEKVWGSCGIGGTGQGRCGVAAGVRVLWPVPSVGVREPLPCGGVPRFGVGGVIPGLPDWVAPRLGVGGVTAGLPGVCVEFAPRVGCTV